MRIKLTAVLLASVLAGVSSETTVASEAPVRRFGVVEGFYGRPWGTEGRLSMLDFMGRHGMNVFVYGPKDDPYHHVKWREPYPEKEAADFRRLLAKAKEQKIDFYWAIHLGDFRDEFDALFAKLEAMYALGVRSFGAFFDDFGDADAERHSAVANRIVREFLAKKGDCAPLLVCPNAYWDTGLPYQRKIGELMDPSVLLIWTGSQICCDITAKDIEAITRDYRRPPFIWWNWSVNDYCRSRLLLGPARGLEHAPVAGIVANPMENCEANKPGLVTFADWCRDPAAYDADAAYAKALAGAYPADVAEAFAVFARHNCDPGMNYNRKFRRPESAGVTDWPAEVRRLAAATQTLKTRLPSVDPKLFWEIEGWLDAQALQVRLAETAFAFAAAKTPAERTALRAKADALFAERDRLGDVHKAKFAAATFPADSRKCVRPVTAGTVLEPLLRRLLGAGEATGQLTWENLDAFCLTNAKELAGDPRGFVVEHAAYGAADAADAELMARATRENVVYLRLRGYADCWMSAAQARLTDAIVNLVIEHFGISIDSTIVSCGTSTGATLALAYPSLSKKWVTRVAARSPVFDLEAHVAAHPELLPSLVRAFATEPDYGAALAARSPLAHPDRLKSYAKYFVAVDGRDAAAVAAAESLSAAARALPKPTEFTVCADDGKISSDGKSPACGRTYADFIFSAF